MERVAAYLDKMPRKSFWPRMFRQFSVDSSEWMADKRRGQPIGFCLNPEP